MRVVTELAGPLGRDPLSAYLQVSYPCKIFVEVGKCADGAQRHRYLAELGWHRKSSPSRLQKFDRDQLSTKIYILCSVIWTPAENLAVRAAAGPAEVST